MEKTTENKVDTKPNHLLSEMRRAVTWKQVVFISIGAPALVMFNLGGISAMVGVIAPLVWTLSVLFGFIESFTYAEMAGRHPTKSGGTSVYGATAWVRYLKIIAPMSLWSNWLAWMPILAIGSGLAAGYFLSIFIPADHAMLGWKIVLFDLNWIKPDLKIRIDLQFIVAFIVMLTVWLIQHAGILRTARTQTILTLGGMIPLLFVAIVPVFMGKLDMSNFTPFVPLSGDWNVTGVHFFLGALFLAA